MRSGIVLEEFKRPKNVQILDVYSCKYTNAMIILEIRENATHLYS